MSYLYCLLAVAVVIVLVCDVTMSEDAGLNDPDYDRDTCEIVVSRGFRCQTHYVTTRDGYILALYRVINPHVKHTRGNPILITHGLFGSSIDFVIPSGGGHARKPPPPDRQEFRSNNLALELANHSYDVWLGNYRGNFYSTNHTRLDPTVDKKYWDFSFDEHVEHDLPAFIGRVLLKTGAG